MARTNQRVLQPQRAIAKPVPAVEPTSLEPTWGGLEVMHAMLNGHPVVETLDTGVIATHYRPWATYFTGSLPQLTESKLLSLEHPSAHWTRWHDGDTHYYLLGKHREAGSHKACIDAQGEERHYDCWELRVFDRRYTWADHLDQGRVTR